MQLLIATLHAGLERVGGHPALLERGCCPPVKRVRPWRCAEVPARAWGVHRIHGVSETARQWPAPGGRSYGWGAWLQDRGEGRTHTITGFDKQGHCALYSVIAASFLSHRHLWSLHVRCAPVCSARAVSPATRRATRFSLRCADWGRKASERLTSAPQISSAGVCASSGVVVSLVCSPAKRLAGADRG